MPSHFSPTVRHVRRGEGVCQARLPLLRVAIQWEAKPSALELPQTSLSEAWAKVGGAMGRGRGTQSGSASDWASLGMVSYLPLTKPPGRWQGHWCALCTHNAHSSRHVFSTYCAHGHSAWCKFGLLHLKPWTGGGSL